MDSDGLTAFVLPVLHEDAELLVINKPAGLVCHPTKGDAMSSLIGRLRLHVGGPGVYLVNRLDRETSGVIVAAKSRVAASELGRLFESGSVSKEYLAIVHGHPVENAFTVEAPLGRDLGSEVAIRDTVRPDGLRAVTRVSVVRKFSRRETPFCVVRAEPLTGRKHQIRIHLAHRGHPIVGDKIYGDDPTRYLRFVRGELTQSDRAALLLEHQALHADRLTFSWRGGKWTFSAKPEPSFLGFASEALQGLR